MDRRWALSANGQTVAPLTREQCAQFALTELESFLELLEQLDPDDWEKPTPCTLWNVRDVVAHQAGHVQMGSGLRGFWAQANPLASRRYRERGMSINDALNQAQVVKRRGLPVAAVVAELRDGTPRSIASRRRLSRAVARIPVPVPPAGLMPLGDLLQHIFPRDMWIHRLDVADATARPFVETPGHDGVMLAQTLADAGRHLHRHEPGISAVLKLRGPAGATWVLNPGPTPIELEMDAADFMRRASGRATAGETLSRVTSDASPGTLTRLLEALQAPF